MLNSLCKNQEGIDLFVKANGLELINKIIENEAELYEEFKPNNDKELFKTRETMDISGKKMKKIKKVKITYFIL